MFTVDSSYSLLTFIFKTPSVFIHPLKTLSPISTFLGTDSPVKAFVSSLEFPSITTPSNGILYPGLIIIISTIFTSSGSTYII